MTSTGVPHTLVRPIASGLAPSIGRVIAHIDMDAFFASVELLRRPELRGKPVIVANGRSARSRGVVMTASYEARKFGVGSAMSLAEAHRRCPGAILVPSDIDFYRRASRAVMSILGEFSESVEVAGLDEAYLDLSASPTPRTRARELKRRVREATGLTCSVGLGDNKLLAKLASDLEKPDGLSILCESEMPERVEDANVRVIPGCGPKTAERLSALGIETVGQLARGPESALAEALGESQARSLLDRANGRDGREIETGREPKSESRETTFAVDTADDTTLMETLEGLAADVCGSLERGGRRGRTVVVKAKSASFRTMTRSRTLSGPTRKYAEIAAVARELLTALDRSEPLRLLGVGVAGLTRDDDQTRDLEGRLFPVEDTAA